MEISREIFNDWLSSKGLSQTTLDHYLYYFDDYFDMYGHLTQRSVSDFLSKKKYANRVCRAFIFNLKEFIRIHYRSLDLSDNELAELNSIELPRITGRSGKKEIRVIPIHYISKIEECLPDERYRLQMLLTFYCGLRLQEMLSVRTIDFNWDTWSQDKDNGEVIVYKAKGKKERTVPVPNVLMVRISRFIRKNPKSPEVPIFINSKHKISLQSRKRTWQRVLNKAGIESGYTKLDSDKKVITETRVHPHKLRHTYSSYLLENGSDLKVIQELLGHSDLSTTQMYLHINKKEAHDKVRNVMSDAL